MILDRRARARWVTTAAVVAVYLAWLGWHRPTDPSQQAGFGFVVTALAVVVVACLAGARPTSAANSVAGAFVGISFFDVYSGPSPEFALLFPTVLGPIAFSLAHLVAIPFHGRYRRTHPGHRAPVTRPAPLTPEQQVAAWRAYRDGVLKPTDAGRRPAAERTRPRPAPPPPAVPR